MSAIIHTSNFLIIPFLFDFAISSSAIVTNLFGQDLGATPFQLGLFGAAWGAVYSIGALVSGKLADNMPPRRLVTSGLLIYVAGMIGCSFAVSVTQLILLACVRGLGCALFWPTFETFLHVKDNAHETNRRVGLFNLGWTLGVTTGSAAGGALMAIGPRLVYRILGGLVLLTCAYLFTCLSRPQSKAKTAQPSDLQLPDMDAPPLAVRMKFLYVSWVAHFALFFVAGATASMFPKVGRIEGIPDSAIGVIFSLVYVGQGLTFLVLSRTSRWHYRLSPILALEAVALLGMVLLGLGNSIAIYVVGMLAQGIGRGMSYASSLFYGLSATEAKGANAGIHEMLVGLAYTFGPLLAGVAAEALTLKASFLVCSVVIIVGWVVQAVLLSSRRRVKSVRPQ